MNCKVCQKPFFPKRLGNVCCSKECQAINNKQHLSSLVIPEKPTEIDTQERLWEQIVANPKAFSHEIIASVMEYFNARDRLACGIKDADYMKEREKILVDCDKASDDPEIDRIHNKLRQQYQEIYGKDIKHG